MTGTRRASVAITAFLAVLAMIATMGSATAAAPSNDDGGGVTISSSHVQIRSLTFNADTDVFHFDVEIQGTHPDTRLKVSTMDCCIEGDQWGVVLLNDNYAPHRGTPPTGCGRGSTTSFTGGRNTLIGANTDTIRVMVFYCRGVDTFAAGMDVRFIATNGAGMTITDVTP